MRNCLLKILTYLLQILFLLFFNKDIFNKKHKYSKYISKITNLTLAMKDCGRPPLKPGEHFTAKVS